MCRLSSRAEPAGTTGRPARYGARGLALLACLAVVVLAPTASGPARDAVVVEVDAVVVAVLPIDPGERLGIRFIHSVDNLPVEDWYVVRDGALVQEATRLIQFGAGMGHIAGQGVGRADGQWWEVGGIGRHIGALVLRIGPASVDHELWYRGQRISLSDCWPGQQLTLRPARVPSASAAAGESPVAWRGCER